MEEHVKNKDK